MVGSRDYYLDVSFHEPEGTEALHTNVSTSDPETRPASLPFARFVPSSDGESHQ